VITTREKGVPPAHDQIHAYIVHENPVVAAGLVSIHAKTQKITAVLGFMRRALHEQRVDVIVCSHDAGMRFLTTQTKQGESDDGLAPVVVIIAAEARELELKQALFAGACGYLQGGCEPREVVDAVRLASRGERYLCHSAARTIAEGLAHTALTVRESEVLDLVAIGHPNKQIAQDLGIQICTVKSHVKSILAKLQASTRTQASAIAVKRGLIQQGFALRSAVGDRTDASFGAKLKHLGTGATDA